MSNLSAQQAIDELVADGHLGRWWCQKCTDHVLYRTREMTEADSQAAHNSDRHVARCARCGGCGKVANSEDQEPWTDWLALPLGSSAAVLLGLVKPIACPRCGGSGEISTRTEAVEAD